MAVRPRPGLQAEAGGPRSGGGCLLVSALLQEMALGKPLTNCGVVVRACAEIFEGMACLNANGIRSALSVQYVQIYQDVPTDLIGGDGKVEIRRDTGQLSGAVETRVSCMADVMQVSTALGLLYVRLRCPMRCQALGLCSVQA